MSTGKDLSIGLTATAKADSIAIRSDKEIYNVWKKLPDAKEWGTPIVQRLIGLEFVDMAVTPGTAYEYKVKDFNGAMGYILAGYQVPPVTNRGKLVFVVESTYAGALTSELARFVQDLQADGYSVVRRDVSKNQSPPQIKEVIKAAYLLDPDHTKTLILFGAVSVPRSGDFTYDGHDGRDGGPSHKGAQSADSYYGSMSGEWTDSTVNNTSAERSWNHNVPGDGRFDQSIIPSDLALIVGRIDLSNMTNFQNKNPPRSELDLLRDYLDRNHAFRNGQLQFRKRAIISDNFQDRDFSAAAWRTFPPCVGSENITEVSSGLVDHLAENDYLMAYACGGGGWISCVGFGDSDQLSLKKIRCPFVFLLGSYFGDFDNESGLMKSVLASGALAVRLAGNPNFFGHRMGFGGTIGESHLLSANNGTFYPPTGNVEDGVYSPVGDDGRGVHQCLLGDPSLVMFPKRNESLRILELQSGPTPQGPWKSLGAVEVEASSPTEFYRLAIR